MVYEGRNDADGPAGRRVYAQETDARTLAEVIDGADVFLGLSAAGVLKPEMVAKMAPKPLILALANPNPEIMPEEARRRAPGRHDLHRPLGLSRTRSTTSCASPTSSAARSTSAPRTINEEMKLAAVRAIAALAREAPSDVVARAYGGEAPVFGPNYLIPQPFDPRLILRIAPAVARGRDGERRRDRGRSPISTPIATARTASSSAPASS